MSEQPAPTDAEILARIQQALQGLRYGELQITVHDSRVVQIERTEKWRLPGEARTNGR